jgi:hypothetical protein
MKKNIIHLLIGATLIFSACESIEKRHELSAVITADKLSDYIDISVDGNNVTCTNNAPGTISYWKLSTGATNHNKTSVFYLPLKNTYTVKLIAYGGSDTVSVTKSFNIEQNDLAFFSDPKWDLLTNGDKGKTWVWASDIPGGMVWGNGSYLSDRAPGWWKQSASDMSGHNGSPNDSIRFSYSTALIQVHTYQPGSGDNKPGTGSGTFVMYLGDNYVKKSADGSIWSYGQIVFSGTTLFSGIEPNTAGNPLHYTFDVLKLTADELVLAFPEPGVTAAGGGTWFYMLKRKGYSY